MKHILVTGGAGYIGTHTIVELMQHGHQVVVVDNLSNSSPVALARVSEIVGRTVPFYAVDCANRQALKGVFAKHPFDSVIHFAGLKAVGESVREPLRYYRNNLDATLSLCEIMQALGVRQLLFSSSATVYGPPAQLPIPETSPAGMGITNPYGRTKYMIEQIL